MDDTAVLRWTEEELEAIAAYGTPREFAPRTVLVTEGDRTDAFYVILEGRVRAYVSDDAGREAMLSVMGPGECFGELAFDDGPRSASVITLERCRVLVVPRAGLQAFIASHPQFALHFIHRLIHRVRTLTANVRSLSLMDVYARLTRLLVEWSVARDGARVIPERPTQAEIASRAGCSREMVSRVLKDLVAGGYLTLERDRIVIHRDFPARW